MSTPTEVTIKTLLTTHDEYNPAVPTPSGKRRCVLEKYRDLYEGGELFENNKDFYLRPRMRDKDDAFRSARLACTHYTRQAGSLTDWLCSCVFQRQPEIEGGNEYYQSLNDDADGAGRDFAALMQDLALECMLYKRAYIGVHFPGGAVSSLADAKIAATGERAPLDACLRVYGAREVDDWGEDDAGNLTWVRIHTSRPMRAGFEPAGEKLEHTWTYIDDNSKSVFRAILDADKEPDGEKRLQCIEFEANTGGFPIFRVEIPDGFWVMHGLQSTQLAIFNADAALSFLYDSNCYQMLAISTDRDIGAVVVGEMSALKLEKGDQAQFVAPSGVPFEQLRQWIDKLEGRLYLLVQAMGLQAASKDEHGRQSGVAKQRDMDAAHALLASYRGRMKDAAEAALRYIANKRNDSINVSISGLDQKPEKPEQPVLPVVQRADTQDDPAQPEDVKNA